MWPFCCCKTTTPIMLGQVGMMGAVIWQQLQSHTGYAKLLSPYKSVAQPVALQQQISPITVSVADPPITVSAADLPITVLAMPETVLKMPSSMNRVQTVMPVILRN